MPNPHIGTVVTGAPVLVTAATVGAAKMIAALREMLAQADPVPDEVIAAAKAAHPSTQQTQRPATTQEESCSPSSSPPPD